jgi:hypothetical protein
MDDIIKKELERIRNLNRKKVLIPGEIVKFAKDERSPLHKYFTWDDGKAAFLYRKQQARGLIRRVVVIPNEINQKQYKVYYSLQSDRSQGLGYRPLETVFKNENFKKELLEQAKKDMLMFKAKYSALTELSDVFESMDNLLFDRV